MSEIILTGRKTQIRKKKKKKKKKKRAFLVALWIAKESELLHVDSEDRRLIRVFAVCI